MRRFIRLCAVMAFAFVAMATAEAEAQPNVVVFVTDDQPAGTVRYMPWLSRQDNFVPLAEAYNNNALCCPARATLLTGNYDTTTGVRTIPDASRFNSSSTLATWFDQAGYRTGLYGKYLNGYPFDQGASYVPPGWDKWGAFLGSADYYDYRLSDGSTTKRYGRRASDYSTQVIARRAEKFIDRSGSDPFFLYVAPYGPHRPWTAAPRDVGDNHDPARLGRNFNHRANLNYYRSLGRMSEDRGAEINRAVRDALASEDRAMRRITKAAGPNTIILFLSDNGYSVGAHRHLGKACGFDECMHIPALVRWGGARVGRVNAQVSNVDFAPTVAQMAGVPAPNTDGTSLVSLLTGAASSLNRPVLMSHVRLSASTDGDEGSAPSFMGLRTQDGWKYIEGADGERQLYDLDRDPHEMENLARRDRHQDRVAALHQQLAAMGG